MRIVPMGVWRPAVGQLVDASELNRVFNYSFDALTDISEKRYSKVVLPLSFVTSVSSGYDNTTPVETRTFRFTPPWDVTVETAQCFAHLVTASGVTVTVIQTSTGLTPVGCVSPLFAIAPVADVTQLQSVFSVNRWTMLAGVEYQFILSGSSFTTARFDVNLNLSIDRWQGSTPTPSPSPIIFSDASSVDADDVNDTVSGLDGAAALFASSPGRSIAFMVRHNVSSASNANTMRIELPRGEFNRMTARITRIQVWCSMASTAGTTVAAHVYTSGGSSFGNASANVAGLLNGYADSGPINISMTSGAGVTAAPANDYSLRILCGNTTVCNKVYAVVWYEW